MGKLKEHLINEQEADGRGGNLSIYNIAIVKSYSFCEEYNPVTGKVEDKFGYPHLKEGYIAGFLDGFAHKLTGD